LGAVLQRFGDTSSFFARVLVVYYLIGWLVSWEVGVVGMFGEESVLDKASGMQGEVKLGIG
jgi:hypothetical protein